MGTSSSPPPRVAGVLGGMGPDATAAFLRAVLRRSGPSARDQDHVPVIVFNNPQVPDRNDALSGRGPSPGPVLAGMARALERAGAEFLLMPCNTAHAWSADIIAATRLPFVSIIEETCRAMLERCPGIGRVGILGTPACVAAGLYAKEFSARGAGTVNCDEAGLARFTELLYAIKRGERGAPVREGMAGLADSLVQRGAEAVIAACTEVPLALAEGDVGVPLIDSLDVLARQCVRYSRGELELPAPGTSR